MKKKLAMIFATCITLSLTIGCTVFGAENGTEEAKQEYDRRIEVRKEKSEKQFNIAKVVTVNENAIVVTLAEKPELPEGEEGERPERPPMQEGEEGERPERPPVPEGEEERPRHDKLEKELNFSEEEIEITLNEDIEIHIEGGEQGSIEDIQPDDIIMIDYAEDGETVKGIFIKEQKE
ncbi:hypothetical protein [Clostridium sp. MD294]|uniref:hypothetical protein n=1 Tax=Clostridium sp. MD294 TaxID=97138 RepID=UPI0002CA1727|nr:hypothetical protein [Clostridium sp. MD294]NDO47788.1 hypothetical protein [Clostridium sp. MD294]USF29894.1 hypothetical protein C820_001314 [Clostridium sp. MD294]